MLVVSGAADKCQMRSPKNKYARYEEDTKTQNIKLAVDGVSPLDFTIEMAMGVGLEVTEAYVVDVVCVVVSASVVTAPRWMRIALIS